MAQGGIPKIVPELNIPQLSFLTHTPSLLTLKPIGYFVHLQLKVISRPEI